VEIVSLSLVIPWHELLLQLVANGMQQKLLPILDSPIEINSNLIALLDTCNTVATCGLLKTIYGFSIWRQKITVPLEGKHVTPMTKQPRDRAAKKKALISAATSLFARRGYEATTTREIAARAGCAEGLIHRYFGGKSGLLSEIVKLHVAQDRATTVVRPPCTTLEAEIRELMDWQLDHLWEERDFLRVAFPCAILQPRLGKLLGKYMPVRTVFIAQRLRGYRHPQFSNDEEIEELARILVSLSFDFGFIRTAILGQNRKQTRILARKAVHLLSRSVPSE
jgi:AcrR family transcriptional regulator